MHSSNVSLGVHQLIYRVLFQDPPSLQPSQEFVPLGFPYLALQPDTW